MTQGREGNAARWIDLEGVVNMRDVGGLPTRDGGRTAYGRLIRSDNLQDLTDASVTRLVGDLGVTAGQSLKTVKTEPPASRQKGIIVKDVAELAARKVANHRFHPPLDIVDGAARICDPFLHGINTGEHVYGKFLKDYKPIDW